MEDALAGTDSAEAAVRRRTLAGRQRRDAGRCRSAGARVPPNTSGSPRVDMTHQKQSAPLITVVLQLHVPAGQEGDNKLFFLAGSRRLRRDYRSLLVSFNSCLFAETV
jgi:hypothetical protein